MGLVRVSRRCRGRSAERVEGRELLGRAARDHLLGDLKATDGNQNYAVPVGTDLSGLTSVVIWCDRFDVAFGSAPIRSA